MGDSRQSQDENDLQMVADLSGRGGFFVPQDGVHQVDGVKAAAKVEIDPGIPLVKVTLDHRRLVRKSVERYSPN